LSLRRNQVRSFNMHALYDAFLPLRGSMAALPVSSLRFVRASFFNVAPKKNCHFEHVSDG